MRSTHAFVILFLAVLAGPLLSPKSAAAEKPNIVLILADDMGYDAVSSYNKAMGPLQTPHIDRLRAEGMRFTDAHSGSAVCTPTRYGLLTGRYCWRTPLKKEVLWDYGRPLIEPQRLTVAGLLKQNGYETAMFGKWHLGLNWFDREGKPANGDLKITDAVWKKAGGSRDRILACEKRIDWTRPISGGPLDHGFDSYFGVDLPNMPPYAWIENNRLTAVPSVPKPKRMFGTEGPMVPGWQLDEILPTLTRRTVEWIGGRQDNAKPFFLYFSLTSPHTPIAPSKPFVGKSKISRYADFLIETDWVVGQVTDALEKAGLSDNTLVIFTADNGTAGFARFKKLESKGVNLRHTFKGTKGQIHEGGHRVPLIARWPGKTPAGSDCGEVVCLNDFMATVAELLGAALPADAAEDSFSILPLITGRAKNLPDRPMVVHHDYKGNFAIRSSQWKYLPGAKPALYDLEADPKESINLYNQHPKIARRLAETLDRYQQTGRSRP
ncbi:MAG: arylsulfatase [Phycisphaeraceae bacterium]|nr:arylsulfatase [Phycisphaeraceae bacterium]